ncbi:Hypothetical predicted protein [Paramuricea clavata]|uniref:Uncharacterized protein n=1 Tax=Paramuricea clavata TaxID=317549 RepID=A0A6S7JTX1_PARCT|nr:Hypothetical predicted protein [Paramuricea clavata]
MAGRRLGHMGLEDPARITFHGRREQKMNWNTIAFARCVVYTDYIRQVGMFLLYYWYLVDTLKLNNFNQWKNHKISYKDVFEELGYLLGEYHLEVDLSVTTVKGEGNKLRLGVDPRDLNKAFKRSHYRMPTIEKVGGHVAGLYFVYIACK